MTRRPVLLALFTFLLALACTSCISLASVPGVAGAALAWRDPRSPGEEIANERALREQTALIADAGLHSSTCFGGTVSSGGALGRPLAGVDVQIVLAAGGADEYTRTGGQGQFHVCLERRSRGLAVELLTGAPRYIDHTEGVHLVFTRRRWATKERDVILDTGHGNQSLDVTLEHDVSELSVE